MEILDPLSPPHDVRIANHRDLFLNGILLPGNEYLIKLKINGLFIPMKTFEKQNANMLKDAIGEGRVYVKK